MKFLAGIFVAFLALPLFASPKMTEVSVDGSYYSNIQDVHIASGGRIVILLPSGGTTVAADHLPPGFLATWGITDDQVAVSKAAAKKQSEEALAQAIRAGYFREVGGVVYDLRKPQGGWIQFTDVKILQVVEDGALVDTIPARAGSSTVFVRNLPHIFADNDKASFKARTAGEFSYINRFGFEHTIHAYDVGRICQRNQIPDVVANGFQAYAVLPGGMAGIGGERSVPSLPGASTLRAIGSGFFVTADGYLLTNFHVVKEARRVEVKYKDRDPIPAQVIQTDRDNDLALLKVAGSGYSPLAFSHKESAELGDEVFTIGFPNIAMQGYEPKYTDGKISSLDGMQDDASEYQISVPVQPGNSGGPLCDINGEVVGIVVARLNDMAALRESGAVPQNVNYAVKAKHAIHLLQNIKGVDGALMAPRATVPPARPIQAVENAVAMVMIY